MTRHIWSSSTSLIHIKGKWKRIGWSLFGHWRTFGLRIGVQSIGWSLTYDQLMPLCCLTRSADKNILWVTGWSSGSGLTTGQCDSMTPLGNGQASAKYRSAAGTRLAEACLAPFKDLKNQMHAYHRHYSLANLVHRRGAWLIATNALFAAWFSESCICMMASSIV